MGVIKEPSNLKYAMCGMKRLNNLKEVETFRTETSGINLSGGP